MLPDFIQRHQGPVATLAIVAIALSSGAVWIQRHRKPASMNIQSTWFYDLGDGKLFPGSIAQLPPIDAASGAGQGVRAHVYSCGQCTEEQWFILHLETYTDAAREAFNRPKNTPEEEDSAAREIEQGRKVAAVPAAGAKVQWLSAVDPRAAEITRIARDRCKDGSPIACWP